MDIKFEYRFRDIDASLHEKNTLEISLRTLIVNVCPFVKKRTLLLTMIIRGTKSVLLHGPSRREYHKIGRRGTRFSRWTRQDGEDRRILANENGNDLLFLFNFFLGFENQDTCTYTMIEGNRIDDHEFVEVVFVGDVISVPGYHVERTVVLFGDVQLAVILTHNLVIDFSIFVNRDWRLKISRVRQAVCSCSENLIFALSIRSFRREGKRKKLPIGPNSGS